MMTTTFGPKVLGRCLQCQVDCHEILAVFPDDSPLAGTPATIGRQLPHGTQVRFLLSTGSVADVLFCRTCADALAPADYWPVWRACLALGDRMLAVGARALSVRRLARQAGMALFPIAIVGRRYAPNGVPMMDRRRG